MDKISNFSVYIHKMFKYFIEYCDNTSIHGVRYLTERKRNWTERIWWCIAIGLSIWLCFSSIRTIWLHWTESPITITFTEREIPIFPTLTICPQIKATKDKFDMESIMKSARPFEPLVFNETILAKAKVITQLCSHPDSSMEESDKFTNDSLYDMVVYLAPTLKRTIRSGWRKDYYHNVTGLFAPVFTDEGYCFSFNTLNSHDIYTDIVIPKLKTVDGNPNVSHWSLDDGYDKEFNSNEYPFRVFHAKLNRAMTVILRAYKEDKLDEISCKTGRGYRILLTIPGEAIRMAQFPFNIPNEGRVVVRIKPKLIITTDGLRGYTPNQRQCFFDSERRLRFFKMYTQNSCEAECWANFTEMKCGCVKFSMPRETSTKLCGVGSLPCYSNAEINLFGEDIVDGMLDKEAKMFRENCNCLPACTTITYDVDIGKEDGWYPSWDNRTLLSEMTVSFREPKIMALQRSASYTFTDFLAICGGLLGLFLGVSLLSIVEFIYYFTLRLFWSIRRWESNHELVAIQGKPVNSVVIDIPHH